MSRKNRKKPVAPAVRVPVSNAKPKPVSGTFSHSIAEWTFNFIILIFATGTIAQPFVIPTSSMEDNLLVGDHLIVDRMAYAPAGPFSRHLLPYEPVKRGDIIVFRYPLNIKEDYIKRVIGVPADSRYWGFVPGENIKGKPLLIYWSYEASTEDLVDFTIGHFVDLAQHFFTKTRWR